MPDGTTLVTKAELEDLHRQVNQGNFRVAWKLTSRHFDCYGSERQRVFLATELISNTVAKALKYKFPWKKDFGDFLELFDQWFDTWGEIK